MIEPSMRTIDGFMALCQKEWVDFGHKFDDRCGHRDDSAADQKSPVFLLFVDCLANLLRQFPTQFEFNMNLLLALMDQLFACRYGSFIENCFNKRAEKGIHDKTAPFWWLVADNKHLFVNDNYVAPAASSAADSSSTLADPIMPSLSPKNIRFFEEYFMRFDPTLMPPRPVVTFY